MSKIGKLIITIPNGVTVSQAENKVTVQGPKGQLFVDVPAGIVVAIEEATVKVSQKVTNDRTTQAFWGLVRANIANAIKGVSEGFEVRLEMVGVGFRGQASGSELTLSLGFSHPVKMKAPQGVTFAMGENNTIIISGSDKMMVGEIAAEIRAVRPPEPYKGKGIKYVGERIRRKAGKTAKAVGGK